MAIILWLLCKYLPNGYHLVALEYQNLKVDFHCHTHWCYDCLATGNIENCIFKFNFSLLQGETYEATIYKNGNRTKAMLYINRILINDIIFVTFELLSQANK